MPVINEIVERHKGEELLVVGHGGVNRIVLLNAIGAPLAGMFNIEQSYGCLNIIDYYADGRTTVKLLNGMKIPKKTVRASGICSGVELL